MRCRLPNRAASAVLSDFPNNQIPTSCFDPTAVDLMKQFVDAPNQPNSLLQLVPWARAVESVHVKLDHELTRNQHLTGYYYFTQHYLAKPFARFQSGGANLPNFGDLTDERIQQLNISHTWTLGSTASMRPALHFSAKGKERFCILSTLTKCRIPARLFHDAVLHDPNDPTAEFTRVRS